MFGTQAPCKRRIDSGIAAKGGVVGIEACPTTPPCQRTRMTHDIDSYMEHFEYVKNLGGIDHVGFGVDCMYGDQWSASRFCRSPVYWGYSKTTVPYQEVPFVKVSGKIRLRQAEYSQMAHQTRLYG